MLVVMLFTISTVAQPPNWTVNSADYSLDASIIAELKINNINSTNTNDIIAVFDNNQVVRGYANISYSSSLNKYLAFISVFSNSNGDLLTFKVYDADNDEIIDVSNTSYTFSPNEVLGDADNPYLISVENSSLSFDEFSEKTNIKIYPNPIQNKFKIDTNFDIKYVKLYSLTGKQVYSNSNIKKNEFIQFNKLESGIYLMAITLINNKVLMKKIVKK